MGTMADDALQKNLAGDVREAWVSFVDTIEPLRPDLFRFCLRLTGNPFDAEDLVHDGMLRAFGTLGLGGEEIRRPRAFLFRVLTNLWIDELRRVRPDAAEAEAAELPARASAPPGVLRDAAAIAFERLSPRERAAVVLKEAFDLSHAEIAEVLSTTEGAVKVALHRGRQRLADEERPLDERRPARRRPRVSAELLDRFVAALRAHDLEAVKALVVTDLEAEVFPSGFGVGAEHHAARGWIHGTFYHHIPEREARREGYPLGLEVRDVAGERAVLVFRNYGEGEALEEVWLIEESAGRIARIRDYCFSPDLVRFVADACGVRFRPVGYRFRPGVYRDAPARAPST
jgi:RNA polymerase sigma-70 factor (ECF subfamily)